MAKIQVPPTKSSLMKMKEQLAVAEDGYELLEQKREILVMELMRMVEQVKLLERELEKRTAEAYSALRKMLLAIGRETAAEVGEGIEFRYELSEKTGRLAGLSLPSLEAKMPELELQYSFLGTYAQCDKTMIEFFELAKLLAELASIRTIVWRLAREVRKTQRRVNSLEKMVIPDTNETIAYITSVLEERERELFFIQKRMKTRVGGGAA